MKNKKNKRIVLAVLIIVIAFAVVDLGLISAVLVKRHMNKPGEDPIAESQYPQPDIHPQETERPDPEPTVDDETLQQEMSQDAEAQLASFVPDYTSAALLNTTPIKYLTIEQGGEKGSIRFNWFSPSGSAGQVVLYNTETGEAQTLQAQTSASQTEAGYFYNKADVSGLSSSTRYTYKVGNNDAWSPEYSYTTPDYDSETTTFVVLADAQIGQAEDEEQTVTAQRYDAVLSRLHRYIPESAFTMHLGDQVAAYNDPSNYDGFFSHLALYSTALIPVVGNHDVDCWDSGGGPWFYERYNVPNRSGLGCNWADTDGDYYVRYGDVLIIVLNTSTVYPMDQHGQYVQNVVSTNSDATWKIVLGHHPAYSSLAKYQIFGEQLQGHYAWMAQNYDVDLFLAGHDSMYTRSQFVTGVNGEFETLWTDYSSGATQQVPDQAALYVTVGTASSSLTHTPDENYTAAVQLAPEGPMAMRVDVTGDTLHMTAYRVDTWEVIDEYTITK